MSKNVNAPSAKRGRSRARALASAATVSALGCGLAAVPAGSASAAAALSTGVVQPYSSSGFTSSFVRMTQVCVSNNVISTPYQATVQLRGLFFGSWEYMWVNAGQTKCITRPYGGQPIQLQNTSRVPVRVWTYESRA